MTSEKWANMASAKKKALYKEYEKDRKMLRYNKDHLLERLVPSLEMMPKLSTLRHEPAINWV
jgi:hypothetical protein